MQPGDTKLSTVFVSTQPMTAHRAQLCKTICGFSSATRLLNLRLALLVRCVRCEIGGEFFEARIIPEGVERRIEPKHRGSERPISIVC